MNKIELARLDQVGRGATIKIAASNAMAKSKAAADYVCDGIDDDVEISEAIASVKIGEGGSVELSEGVFYLNDNLNISECTVLIKGQGQATKIDGANIIITDAIVDLLELNSGSDCDVFISEGTANVRIMNCCIGNIWDTGEGLILIGNDIIGLSTYGNIFPSTTELLQEVNSISSVTFLGED